MAFNGLREIVSRFQEKEKREEMITKNTFKNDIMQAFKNDYIYTMKKDNLLYIPK
jgi:hypothetical protein